MRTALRTKFTRFLAVPAVAAAGVALVTAPAHAAGSITIRADSAAVADAGRTLNVSVTYRCNPEFSPANITVGATQSAVGGQGKVLGVPCTGGERTVTVPVTATTAGAAWTTGDRVDLALYIVDREINRARNSAWLSVS
ncbi:hypothetical protein ABT093_26885 [Kitasatospora sp. NPDC002551]|uniref:hypothetical protein n=1 Tax=unclassified Kitasatospora TaxID=2633591 RepID=UPI0033178D16